LFSLAGKTAFVSGASSVIGQHIAKTFASVGARVVLSARRESKLAQAMRDDGLFAWAVRLDVIEQASIADAWPAAEKLLGCPEDIHFNWAGILYTERFLSQGAKEVQRVFETNLKGAFLVA
jgi:NAD(P)-dependent dehydrogenase (short-subunit alcohol dehydrogenase family)